MQPAVVYSATSAAPATTPASATSAPYVYPNKYVDCIIIMALFIAQLLAAAIKSFEMFSVLFELRFNYVATSGSVRLCRGGGEEGAGEERKRGNTSATVE